MTKLELVKEQVKKKFGESAFLRLSSVIDSYKFPTKVQAKMWQKVLDGELNFDK